MLLKQYSGWLICKRQHNHTPCDELLYPPHCPCGRIPACVRSLALCQDLSNTRTITIVFQKRLRCAQFAVSRHWGCEPRGLLSNQPATWLVLFLRQRLWFLWYLAAPINVWTVRSRTISQTGQLPANSACWWWSAYPRYFMNVNDNVARARFDTKYVPWFFLVIC